jgi:hypothetical protein
MWLRTLSRLQKSFKHMGQWVWCPMNRRHTLRAPCALNLCALNPCVFITYVYPPAPACQGPSDCGEYVANCCPKSFHSFGSQADNQVFHLSQVLPIIQITSWLSSFPFNPIPSQFSSLQLAACQSGISFWLFAVSCLLLAYPLSFPPWTSKSTFYHPWAISPRS